MSNSKDKILATFNCPAELWQRFKARCRQGNANATSVLLDLMTLYLETDIGENLDQGRLPISQKEIDQYIYKYLDKNLYLYIDKYLDICFEQRLENYFAQQEQSTENTEESAEETRLTNDAEGIDNPPEQTKLSNNAEEIDNPPEQASLFP